jgi:hypothetical protein
VTAEHAAAAGDALPHAGSVVLAGRPLRPGTDPGRLARFSDDRWDLSPAVFEDHMPALSLNFSTVPPRFLEAAKTYVWVLLNTSEPAPLRRSGGTRRLSVLSVTGLRGRLFPFFDFLASRGVGLLSEVTPDDYDAYLARIRDAEITLNQREDLLTEVRRLWSYRAQMPATHALPDAPPWDGDDTQHLVGARPAATENSTRRIPEDIMRPLLLWSIRYVDDFSRDILPAWREYLELADRNRGRRKEPLPGPRRRSGDLAGEIPRYLDQLRARGDGLPGKRGDDGTLRVDWPHLVRIFGCGCNNLHPGQASRHLIEDSGLPVEDGAPLAAPVTACLDGEPWLPRRIRYLEAHRHARLLSTACLVVIAYLSGMRIGEVLSLRRGCVTHDERAGLWLIHGTTWKSAKDDDGSKTPQGILREDPWVVIPVVARAIAVLERLHDSPLLFPSLLDARGYTTTRTGTGRITARITNDLGDFKKHVNDYCAARGRNDPIPNEDEGRPLNGSRFRRTLAWHIYRRPRGLVAGAIQYGEVSTQIFLGYAGNYASGFRDVAAMEEFLARLEELADDVARLDAGEHVSGPAATQYAARVRDGQNRFAGRVIRSARAARDMVANPSLQVFPGHGMTCVFDASKALCEMTRREDDPRRTPALDDCRPNCGNIARTDRDITVIRADIDRLTTITADPLSPPIRHRREASQLRRLEEIATRHEQTRPASEDPARD